MSNTDSIQSNTVEWNQIDWRKVELYVFKLQKKIYQALHGMEERIKEYAATLKGDKRANKKALSLIRYADDFVILHENSEVIKNCQKIIGEWLKPIGLELNQEKTKITHTLHELESNKPGFNFLGFNIRQHLVGKYQSGKDGHGRKLGFKTIIKPSKEKVAEHYRKLANIVNRLKAAPQHLLIANLAPVIRGWSNYYRAVCSKETYSKVHHLLVQKLLRWGYRRHPNKNKTWANNKYWHTIGLNNWRFCCIKNDIQYALPMHPETKIIRHVKVKGEASPYDGNHNYWATRMGKHPELKGSVARLLKKQKGKCNHCHLSFQPEDKIERDHITPLKAGGDNTIDNLQLLHKHCHDKKTIRDLSLIKKHKYRKMWKEHFKKVNKQFEQSKWNWIEDIPTLV